MESEGESGSRRRVRFQLPPSTEEEAPTDRHLVTPEQRRQRRVADNGTGKYDNVKVVITVGQLKKLSAANLPECQVNLVRWDPPEAEASSSSSVVTSGAKRRRRRQRPRSHCDKRPQHNGNKYKREKRLKRYHADPNAYRCSTCGKCYSNRNSLTYHRITYHLSFERGGLHPNEKPYRCSLCGRRWAQVTNLYRHTRTFPECQFGADAYRSKNKHPVPKPYRCSMCPRSFVLQRDLKHHTRFHSK